MDLIDLHAHTTASDGTLTPSQLVALAAKSGLKAIAVTDHDTIDGLAEALAAGAGLEMEVVPGVEISVQGGPTGALHMLGLWVDPKNPGLAQGLERLQRARAERNPKILEKLNGLGIPLTMDEVEAQAGGGQVGRPHFAQAMIAKGVVADRGAAFGRFLAAGKPAYVPKYRFEPRVGMEMIRAAGGLPVLAHPGMLKLPLPELEDLLRGLIKDGLQGIETYYSEHDTATTRALLGLAARLGLVVSGGSDFHGAAKPDISLGTGWGELRIPAGLLTALKRRLADLPAPDAA